MNRSDPGGNGNGREQARRPRSRQELRGLSRVDRGAVNLARRALARASAGGGDDPELAAYRKSVEKAARAAAEAPSPFLGRPYRLVFAKNARSARGVTLRRPAPYTTSTSTAVSSSSSSSSSDRQRAGLRASRVSSGHSAIDPRLLVGGAGGGSALVALSLSDVQPPSSHQGNSSLGSARQRFSNKYVHVKGGALDRAPFLPIFGQLDGGSSIGCDSNTADKRKTAGSSVLVSDQAAAQTPGPSTYFQDGHFNFASRTLNGGVFGSAPASSSLDRIIRRSQSVPGPAKYNVSGMTRDGRGHSHGRKFSTGVFRSGSRNSASAADAPGPFEYDVTLSEPKPKGYVAIAGQAGDRFLEVGPQRLETEEASCRPIAYHSSPTREHGIDNNKGGHCWDVATCPSSIAANSGTEEHVAPGSYRPDPGIGGVSLLRRTPFSTSFVRPDARKNTGRRPLHMGIFARLAASASAKAQSIEAADRAIERMAAHQKMKKDRKRRKRRERLAQRSGVPTFIVSK
jgi:hypothetical protein